MNVWLNAIGYQLVWLASVWGATHAMPWLGLVLLVPFALIYLCRDDGQYDAWLLLAAVGTGATLDSIYAGSGLIAYASPLPLAQAAPLWILGLWAAFALTLRHSMRFLQRHWLVGALFGAAGAPLAYLAAARGWHAVDFPRGAGLAAGALALGWAVALPVLLQLAGIMEKGGRARRTYAHG